MTALITHTCCQYLTTGTNWRDEDHHARVIVKAVKGEDFNGYFDAKVEGKPVRIDQRNKDAGLDLAARVLASRLVEIVQQNVTLVPVPNSNACVGVDAPFRTLRLAEKVAEYSASLAVAKPLMLWAKAKAKQHQTSGYRQASQFIPNLVLTAIPARPIVLIDDVITSGSQMLACTYILRKAGVTVLFGMAVGRTTQVQTSQALEWVEGTIEQMII